MNERQRLFCLEYAIDRNGTRAAIRAGYAESKASLAANRLLKRDDVRAEIDAALGASMRRINLTREAVIAELARLALSDPREAFDAQGNMLPIHKMPEDFRRTVGGWDSEEGVVSKVRLRSKEKALELLGKHFKLWDDTPQAPVTLVVRMDGSAPDDSGGE
jgi:phage terminase small subunit